MEEKDIEYRFHLVQKEIEAAVSLIQYLKLDLFSAIDALKIEVGEEVITNSVTDPRLKVKRA